MSYKSPYPSCDIGFSAGAVGCLRLARDPCGRQIQQQCPTGGSRRPGSSPRMNSILLIGKGFGFGTHLALCYLFMGGKPADVSVDRAVLADGLPSSCSSLGSPLPSLPPPLSRAGGMQQADSLPVGQQRW